jgi:hypothetical protein
MKNLAITMYRFPGVKTDIYERNVRSFREHNPDAHIDCMTPSDFADPNLRRLATSPRWRSAWWHSDKVLYDLYRRKPNFEWYLYSEWDVFCNIELSKMIEPVKQYQILAHRVCYPTLDVVAWEHDKRFLPPETVPYMAQARPLAGIAVRNDALERLAAPHSLHSSGAFCEVRLATLARIHGLSMAQYPLYSHKLWTFGLTPGHITSEGLWHPVKFLVP